MTRYVAVFLTLALAIGLAGRYAYVAERQEVEAAVRAQDEETASVQATRLAAWPAPTDIAAVGGVAVGWVESV